MKKGAMIEVVVVIAEWHRFLPAAAGRYHLRRRAGILSELADRNAAVNICRAYTRTYARCIVVYARPYVHARADRFSLRNIAMSNSIYGKQNEIDFMYGVYLICPAASIILRIMKK